MQKGFAPVMFLVGIVILAAAAAGAYYFVKSQVPKTEPQNTVVVSNTPQPVLPSIRPDDIGLPKDAVEFQKEIEKQSSGKTQLSFTLPEDFPKEFPVYPRAKLLSSLRYTQEGLSFLISWVTDDELDAVETFYTNRVSQKPWNVVSPFRSGALSRRELTFTAVDFPDSLGMIVLSQETTGRGKTSIRISYTKR